MTIGIACDHAGFSLKEYLVRMLKREGYRVSDFGIRQMKKVDYPDYGQKVAREVSGGTLERGILICGTGIGMSIVANRFPGVRAALCNDPYLAEIARSHNDANVLVLGGRIVAPEFGWEITKVFLEIRFSGGRHYRRVRKMDKGIEIQGCGK